MSYANGTQFYNLPQTVGTDKRDWFDTNEAFAAVDAALHAAATGQAADAEAISTINSKLAADEADIAALQTASSTQAASISTLQTTVNGQATQIADVRQDAEDMITSNNEGAAATSTRAYAIGDYFIYNDVLYKATAAIAIGDTIVPNTNCEATNVDTEITEVKTDLIPIKSRGEVNITTISTETWTQALARLQTQIDYSKLREQSMLIYGNNYMHIAYCDVNNSVVSFTSVGISGSTTNTSIVVMSFAPNNSHYRVADGVTTGASDFTGVTGQEIGLTIVY